jgi:Asp-tRNA(Asn)/Glu-tRNA(Gln) amidotransferase A subunit family amidase
VRDSAALLDATHGPDPGAPYWAPPVERPYLEEVGSSPGRLRIALQTVSFNGSDTHADCVAAARDAAGLCAELGHEVEEARLAIDAEAFGRASQVIISANLRLSLDERAAELGRELREDDVEPATWAMAQLVLQAGATDYARAIRTIHAVGREVARFLEGHDVLLTPTMATPPVELGVLALTNTDVASLLVPLMATVGYTQLFNASGNPAMSVPLHWNAAGLPVGVQFAGRFGDEATLYRLAAQLEAARPWFDRRPADPPA